MRLFSAGRCDLCRPEVNSSLQPRGSPGRKERVVPGRRGPSGLQGQTLLGLCTTLGAAPAPLELGISPGCCGTFGDKDLARS